MTKMQEVLTEANLGDDETIVALHAMLLTNTVGGRPSDSARTAVRQYRQLGRHAFIAAHYADNERALRACGCEACARSLAV